MSGFDAMFQQSSAHLEYAARFIFLCCIPSTGMPHVEYWASGIMKSPKRLPDILVRFLILGHHRLMPLPLECLSHVGGAYPPYAQHNRRRRVSSLQR